MKAAGATWCGMDSRVCMVWGGEAFGLCSLWGFRLRFCKLTTCVSRVCVCVSRFVQRGLKCTTAYEN